MIQNRINDTKLVDWQELVELQPSNLKVPYNIEYLKKSILKNGFAMPFYGWEHDGKVMVVDGHSRKDVLLDLIADGIDVPTFLPCTMVTADDEQEAVRLLVEVFNQKSNPIDQTARDMWFEDKAWEVNEVDWEGVNMVGWGDSEEEDDDKEKGEGKEKENEDKDEDFFIPDCIYNSNNIYDIPTLKIENQATELILPLKPYGAEARTNGGIGTYHFYVDDYRFEAIWKSPLNIIKSGCTQIVEPNLSLYDSTPISYGLFLIYKKRWISRYLQEKGFKVYADLNVSSKFVEYNVMGIPEGYNAFFTRGYTGRLHHLESELEIAQRISGKKEPNLVVYGGSKEVKEFCAKNNLIFIKDYVNDK